MGFISFQMKSLSFHRKQVKTHSEVIMSWLKQKSSTSRSINDDVSFLSVLNGKFSEENQRMKTHQVKEKSVTSRVQVRNHLYTVNAYPDFTLYTRFVHQADEIADAIENNQTRLATYLSERLILDYGTHVITSIKAGATLVQEDYLTNMYVFSHQSDMSSVSASAGFNFFSKVKFDFDSKESQQTSETLAYQKSITYSLVQSHGGALFYPSITLQKWQESTSNNLVAIDRSGLPLHYFFNPSTFPELPIPTVHKLALSVQQAAERYYNINVIPGCVDINSPNFNFQANVDDASCEGPVTNLSFGGMYQMCTPLTPDGDVICDDLAQKNPATGGYSCSQPYTASLLHSETVIYKSCDTVCEKTYHARQAKIYTYWCFTNQRAPAFSGYLFGGLFGPSLQNPLTKSQSCPPNFFARRLLPDGMMVCLSNDYERGTQYSVPFGGFFSCYSGNPLASGQYRCPPKFSQHLAAISDGCQVLYCVQSAVFTGGEIKPVHLPPFTRPPSVSMLATNTVAIMTEGSKAWVRLGESKKWQLVKLDEVDKIVRGYEESSKQMSGGGKASVACGVMTLVAVLVAGAVFFMKKRRRLSGLRADRGYEEFNCDGHIGRGVSEDPTQALLA
ncbi:Macrophage-expressed gene 1 protein [Triplophysa tibetana]|uniref:Macrophage-expressed gene 1 protein n=1 Tax=Triplophysa tibetana TaxID=1572043 RepID=A0A5A9NWJ1_9TELE|nr:Macrophage-expressed gene 1 protein [Triplophysa tibetana]